MIFSNYRENTHFLLNCSYIVCGNQFLQ